MVPFETDNELNILIDLRKLVDVTNRSVRNEMAVKF